MKIVLITSLMTISKFSFALYGGRPVSVNAQYKAVVTIHLNDPGQPQYDEFCSGVLVKADTVLTTGHCMEVMASEVYDKWNLFAYEPNLISIKADGIKYEVADVMIARSYADGIGYNGEDLAIIKLMRPIVSIKPIKIIAQSILKPGLKTSMVVGGKMASSTITSVAQYSGNTVIFTDGSKSGICEGDSGGALLVSVGQEQYLAGILSAQSKGCERRTGASVFPRLFYYKRKL